jgi:hypothetical protein
MCADYAAIGRSRVLEGVSKQLADAILNRSQRLRIILKVQERRNISNHSLKVISISHLGHGEKSAGLLSLAYSRVKRYTDRLE